MVLAFHEDGRAAHETSASPVSVDGSIPVCRVTNNDLEGERHRDENQTVSVTAPVPTRRKKLFHCSGLKRSAPVMAQM
jgi:hypothetical protein